MWAFKQRSIYAQQSRLKFHMPAESEHAPKRTARDAAGWHGRSSAAARTPRPRPDANPHAGRRVTILKKTVHGFYEWLMP